VLTPIEMVLRLSVAALLGGLLGFEREAKSKPAGLRTHMLVALGSACFSLAAFGLAEEARDGAALGATSVDPTRVVQGIIGGIGFLGAGAIIRDRGAVRGLTTAGSIWLTGAVGIAAGAGNFLLAGLAVVLAMAILSVLGWLEQRVQGRRAASGGTPPDDPSG